jgi:hypothetical protein
MNVTAKVVRDGKVAVLYSPGFGAGWSTWNPALDGLLVFCPALVAAVEAGTHVDLSDEAVAALLGLDLTSNDDFLYTGGLSQVEIAWVPVGARFEISEYDGSESVRVFDESEWLVA